MGGGSKRRNSEGRRRDREQSGVNMGREREIGTDTERQTEKDRETNTEKNIKKQIKVIKDSYKHTIILYNNL